MPMSPASSSSSVAAEGADLAASSGPFHGLVICVSGLSKERRKQVMEATERLGGQYSLSLSPLCTHLVVESLTGRKFKHALNHGVYRELFVVSVGWFLDSVNANARLSEMMYSLHHAIKSGNEMKSLGAVLGQVGGHNVWAISDVGDMVEQYREQNGLSTEQHALTSDSPLFGCSIYIDPNISSALRNKVVEAITSFGAVLIYQWFVGCSASYVVSEQSSIQRYLGHADNIVTPMWILKACRDRSMQRCVCISADLARDIHTLLGNSEEKTSMQEACGGTCSNDTCISEGNTRQEERLQIARLAKLMVRSRRLQLMQVEVHPIFPSILLETICWSISDPASIAAVYIDSSSTENVSKACLCPQRNDNEVEASFANLNRPLTESEKKEEILRHHFLTILFPVDRFGEMGPAARTYFSDTGFECLHVLDLIYEFYQESMTVEEVEAAIHTDSRHADELRTAYSNEATAEACQLAYRRIDFVGSRRSFEMLKRVSIDNSCSVYELILRT